MTSTPKVAIVTGAARGIGAATAERLARDGYAIGVLDLTEEAGTDTVAAIEAGGGTALAVAADVSKADAVEAAVARVAAQLGPPLILVNNAGVTRDNLIFKMTEDDWDTVIDVHLKGAFLMSRACQTAMVAARWGRIVTISSVSAQGNRGQVNYSAAKAGIQGFTKTLCKELGRFGITANCVAPGFTVTDMTAKTAERLGLPFDTFLAQIAADIPVGRVGQPEDIAHAVAFLVHPDSGFISGEVIYVAGGPHD